MLGPVTIDPSWQAKAGQGFDPAGFAIDWQAKQATCPQGNLSRKWKPTQDRGDTRSFASNLANTTVAMSLPQPLYDSHHQPTSIRGASTRSICSHSSGASASTHPGIQKVLCHSSGIEGTISQGVRAFGMRRSRYIGRPNPFQQNTPLGLTALPTDTVEVTDPTHPLYGLSFPLIGITVKQRLGRVCLVWLHPGIERAIPVRATNLAGELHVP